MKPTSLPNIKVKGRPSCIPAERAVEELPNIPSVLLEEDESRLLQRLFKLSRGQFVAAEERTMVVGELESRIVRVEDARASLEFLQTSNALMVVPRFV